MFITAAKWRYFSIYWLGMSLRHYCSDFASNLIPHGEYTPRFYKSFMKCFKSVVSCDSNMSVITTKMLYNKVMSCDVVIPRIVSKFPRVCFTKVWCNIHNVFIDPFHRDVAWRIAHHVLPVGGYLYEKNISKFTNCYFCKDFESLLHLFVFCKEVLPFWKFVESVMNQYASQTIKINASTILFHCFQTSKVAENNTMLNLMLCLGKYCIWFLRNQAKFENEIVNVTRIISVFMSHLTFRLKTDFMRLNRKQFVKIWCRNSVFATIDNGGTFHVVLKPP